MFFKIEYLSLYRCWPVDKVVKKKNKKQLLTKRLFYLIVRFCFIILSIFSLFVLLTFDCKNVIIVKK